MALPIAPLAGVVRVSDDPVYAVAFLPSAPPRLCTGGADEVLRLWSVAYDDDKDSKTRKEAQRLARQAPQAHALGVVSLACSGDGARLATAGLDGALSVWAVPAAGAGAPSSAPLVRLATRQSEAPLDTFCVAFSGATTLATGSFAGALHLWRLVEDADEAFPDEEDEEAAPEGQGDAVAPRHRAGAGAGAASLERVTSVASRGGAFAMSVAFSPDGQRAACGHSDGTVSLFDVARGALVSTIEAHQLCVRALSWSADGRLFTGSDDGRVGVFDVGSSGGAPLVCSLTGHLGFVTSVAACAARPGLLASGAADKSVKLWDERKREVVHTFEGHAAAVNCVAWAPEEAGMGGTLRLASVSEAGGLMLHSGAAAGLQ